MNLLYTVQFEINHTLSFSVVSTKNEYNNELSNTEEVHITKYKDIKLLKLCQLVIAQDMYKSIRSVYQYSEPTVNK